MRIPALALALVVVAAAAAGPAVAADPDKPHEHHGKLKPYPRPPPPLSLSDAEKKIVDSGKPLMRQQEADAGGRGYAIFKVNANPDLVWATINDFPSYPKWIDEVKKCQIYKKNGGKIDVDFVLKSFPVTVEYYIHHDYDMEHRWGTWTLDYTRNSDLDDSVGFWRVNEVEGHPDQAIVEYSVDIAIKGWVPGFIRDLLVDKGLKQATQWVKVQSEKKQAAQPKAAPAPTPPPAAPAPTP